MSIVDGDDTLLDVVQDGIYDFVGVTRGMCMGPLFTARKTSIMGIARIFGGIFRGTFLKYSKFFNYNSMY